MSVFKEIREHFRYRLDTLFARGWIPQFLLLVVLTLLSTAIGMTAVFFGLFAPENQDVEGIPRGIDQGFWDSLWWALKHALNVRHFDANYGATVPIILYSLLISLAGLIIFGMIVGMVTSAMERRLARLRQGNSPVKERNHILILGWSEKVVSVIRYLSMQSNAKKIVILAPRETSEMQEALRVAGVYQLPVQIILRTGLTTVLSELERVAFRHARSIIVMAFFAGESLAADRDSEAIKTMMLLTSCNEWTDRRPLLVGEITHKRNYDVATVATRASMPIVSGSGVIGKIIAQCIRHPGLSTIYNELFSSVGNRIYVSQYPSLCDQPFSEIAYRFETATPIGVAWKTDTSRSGRTLAALNPEPEYEFAEEEQLVYIAHQPITGPARQTLNRPDIESVTQEFYRSAPERILLLGWNPNIYDVLTELDGHARPGTVVDILSAHDEALVTERIATLSASVYKNVTVNCRKSDPVQRRVLSELELDGYQSIAVLADESFGEADPDARSLRTLLLLSDIRNRLLPNLRPTVLVEFRDAISAGLIGKLPIDDVIVSPEIISMQLAQIACQQVLGRIYHELLSAGGVEISLRPAELYSSLKQTCSFSDLVAAAQQRSEIALGVRLQNRSDPGGQPTLDLNPEKTASWHMRDGDKVVVIAQEIYA